MAARLVLLCAGAYRGPDPPSLPSPGALRVSSGAGLDGVPPGAPRTSVHAPLVKYRYEWQPGFIGAGNDVLPPSLMTVPAALTACDAEVRCRAVTHEGGNDTSGMVKAYLKSVGDASGSPGWSAWIKIADVNPPAVDLAVGGTSRLRLRLRQDFFTAQNLSRVNETWSFTRPLSEGSALPMAAHLGDVTIRLRHIPHSNPAGIFVPADSPAEWSTYSTIALAAAASPVPANHVLSPRVLAAHDISEIFGFPGRHPKPSPTDPPFPLRAVRSWSRSADGAALILALSLTNPGSSTVEVGGLGFAMPESDGHPPKALNAVVWAEPHVGGMAGNVQFVRVIDDEATLVVTPARGEDASGGFLLDGHGALPVDGQHGGSRNHTEPQDSEWQFVKVVHDEATLVTPATDAHAHGERLSDAQEKSLLDAQGPLLTKARRKLSMNGQLHSDHAEQPVTASTGHVSASSATSSDLTSSHAPLAATASVAAPTTLASRAPLAAAPTLASTSPAPLEVVPAHTAATLDTTSHSRLAVATTPSSRAPLAAAPALASASPAPLEAWRPMLEDTGDGDAWEWCVASSAWAADWATNRQVRCCAVAISSTFSSLFSALPIAHARAQPSLRAPLQTLPPTLCALPQRWSFLAHTYPSFAHTLSPFRPLPPASFTAVRVPLLTPSIDSLFVRRCRGPFSASVIPSHPSFADHLFILLPPPSLHPVPPPSLTPKLFPCLFAAVALSQRQRIPRAHLPLLRGQAPDALALHRRQNGHAVALQHGAMEHSDLIHPRAR